MFHSSRAKNFLITGRPGSGKTTACMRIVEILRKRGIEVDGFISREVRRGGSRIGFELIDLKTGERDWLAHISIRSPFRVSKYGVNPDAVRKIAIGAIDRALRESDVVVIDEIAKMELTVPEFENKVIEALDSDKIVLATIQLKKSHPAIARIKSREDIEMIYLNPENRDEVPEMVARKILNILGSSPQSI